MISLPLWVVKEKNPDLGIYKASDNIFGKLKLLFREENHRDSFAKKEKNFIEVGTLVDSIRI